MPKQRARSIVSIDTRASSTEALHYWMLAKSRATGCLNLFIQKKKSISFHSIKGRGAPDRVAKVNKIDGDGERQPSQVLDGLYDRYYLCARAENHRVTVCDVKRCVGQWSSGS